MWDLSNMLVGWLIGRFGLFGIKKDEIDEPTLNLIGEPRRRYIVSFFWGGRPVEVASS